MIYPDGETDWDPENEYDLCPQCKEEFLKLWQGWYREEKGGKYMSDLNKLKHDLAVVAHGITREEALQQGICIDCKQPNPLSRCSTEAGRREYGISAICEECWDKMFAGDDDA